MDLETDIEAEAGDSGQWAVPLALVLWEQRDTVGKLCINLNGM